MPKMVFIGGTGRSGTSILKDVLASHPDAASLPFEYRFIIDPDGIVDFYASFSAIWSPYIADRKLKRLAGLLHTLADEPLHHWLLSRLIRAWNRDGKTLSPRMYHGWELKRHLPNFERHTQRLMQQLVEFSFPACWVGSASYRFHPQIEHLGPRSRRELAGILGDFIRDVINDLLQQSGKGFFVEDNTWNILVARELLELLPEARLIHVYRDPRDVVASFSQQRWSPADKQQGARWYKAMMTHWFRVRSELPAGSTYELKLEELVAAPEAMLRDICSFIGVPFDERMLQVDLGHAHSGRWKREYTTPEKQAVQAILADLIERLGYPLTA